LIQADKQNIRRFPGDFMFQLIREEFNWLKSQFVTFGESPRAAPYAFTKHGVAILSSMLRAAIADPTESL
jgi:hypothetical protein